MAAGFRVRKIQSECSIGDRLKKARIRQKISVAQVEEHTKIRSKFILALESDSWEQIPSEVYGRGYLERYISFLKLPLEEVMNQYEKERHAYARHCQDAKVELAPTNTVRISRFTLTPPVFFGATIAVVVILFGGMVVNQIHRFTAVPFLELATPVSAAGSSELVLSTKEFTIKGRTSSGTSVFINNQAAIVLEDGAFSGSVNLEKGINPIIVKAVNAKGKEISETLSVIVK